MTQSIDLQHKRLSLPIVQQQSAIDSELAKFEAEQRTLLGLEPEQQWIEDMANASFTKSERADITILVGGLTMAHDVLVAAAFQGLGYAVVPLDAPNFDALRVGKEFGNRGQCNPTYFTVGNLVQFLIQLRDQKGMSCEEIIRKFVFLTAGACGPCRFGMYVTEYRKALRDAGFDGFRVMLFQQQGGLSQATGDDSGLELKPAFFIGLLKALVAGDTLNALGYRIRPYEVVPGSTDAALTECKQICIDALANRRSVLRAMWRCRQVLSKLEVDRSRIKPKVAIIGEFWAMTTEGDGNYRLQRFIEEEGGEVDIQIVTAWILYSIWEFRFDTKERESLRGRDAGNSGLGELGDFGVFKRRIGLWAADRGLRLAFHSFARLAGLKDYHLADMDEVAQIAAPHYSNDLRGGEGHMEVGKLILNVVKQKATMTLSVKPFGCMPSSGVSDGVQSLICEKFPGTIYCAVETSGDGAVNFQSRVQMYLFKAKQAAQAEFDRTLGESGLDRKSFAELLTRQRKFAHALFHPKHRGTTTATDIVFALGDKKPAWRRVWESTFFRNAEPRASVQTTQKGVEEQAPHSERRPADSATTHAQDTVAA